MLLAAIFINWMIIALIQVVLLLLVGTSGTRSTGPHDAATFLAGPVVSLVFFILVALSGLYFPVRPGSGLATFTGIFPIRRLILAMVDSFNGIPGTSVWTNLLVIASWGAVGVFVSLRRWAWSPKRG